MVPSLEELKLQCRIDADWTEEDDLLKGYAGAARKRAENFINRKLYDDTVPEEDNDGLVISDDIKLAIMLAVGFWYDTRTPTNLPAGFSSLLEPYRFIPL
ncbi:uncharacterized phage protein (possible DNA packaging) [Serratia fonticola]|uniref:head-tail connector protein n=1 Tax=Serratia fonticola TaxID=47917 RepID=UPI000BA25D2A|nr:head-tail connector protein [Serratia fonticola]MBL5904447.1 phage gp6-like head-tail connector protein [Serratia fonticola]PAA97727.1 hypothetical protein CJJ13_08855 [Serratia fonticola]CAI2037052.1 uncharacterized phage protein (possible DNA packaging) [Serratia fonticola]